MIPEDQLAFHGKKSNGAGQDRMRCDYGARRERAGWRFGVGLEMKTGRASGAGVRSGTLL